MVLWAKRTWYTVCYGKKALINRNTKVSLEKNLHTGSFQQLKLLQLVDPIWTACSEVTTMVLSASSSPCSWRDLKRGRETCCVIFQEAQKTVISFVWLKTLEVKYFCKRLRPLALHESTPPTEIPLTGSLVLPAMWVKTIQKQLPGRAGPINK